MYKDETLLKDAVCVVALLVNLSRQTEVITGRFACTVVQKRLLNSLTTHCKVLGIPYRFFPFAL